MASEIRPPEQRVLESDNSSSCWKANRTVEDRKCQVIEVPVDQNEVRLSLLLSEFAYFVMDFTGQVIEEHRWQEALD